MQTQIRDSVGRQLYDGISAVSNLQKYTGESELRGVSSMGKTVDMHRFSPAEAHRHLTIYVNTPQSVQTASVSVGKMLAAAILKTEPQRRSKRLGQILGDVFLALPDNTTVRDIDVLFNPAYEVDVLRLLETLYREKPYSVIWPGELSDGKLTYSEYGYADYKEYAISDYDILCVC